MKYIDELFEKYEIRKSKKQKTAFIEWVTNICKDNKWDVEVEKGSMGVRNIVIGNADEAEVIFTAHYDTCANMFVPNFITPKNFMIYLLYQIILMVVLLIPVGIVTGLFAWLLPDYIELSFPIGYGIFLIELFMLMCGPANKHTANDNTSGVATILSCLEKFDSSKDKVAFILFDLEEAGLLGSGAYASKHKRISGGTLLVNFDCVSDGETMLFVLNKRTKDLVDTFKESYENPKLAETDVVSGGVFYPSDQTAFKKGVGVCAMKKNKIFKTGYIDRIHTVRDTVFRKENIQYLVDGSYKLYKNISK